MPIDRRLIVALALSGLAPLAAAQAPPAPPPNPAAQKAVQAVEIVEARKANAALLKQYSWYTRTELFKDGELKDTKVDLVNYGPDGKLQHAEVSNQSDAKSPRGPLRRAIADDKKNDFKEYMHGLKKLLEQYTLPDAGSVLNFMLAAKVNGPDATGLVSMSGNGVVQPGDSLTIFTDAATRQTRKAVIVTTYQGDPVNATATFETLPSGLTHVASSELVVPSKKVKVQVQNFNYNKSN